MWESIYLDKKDSAYGYDSNLDVVINNGRYNSCHELYLKYFGIWIICMRLFGLGL